MFWQLMASLKDISEDANAFGMQDGIYNEVEFNSKSSPQKIFVVSSKCLLICIH